MDKKRTTQLLLIAAALLCLLVAGKILNKTQHLREKYKLSLNPVKEGVPPQVAIATTALGGFRGIFIDLLWLRAIDQKEEGNFYEMIQLYDWITTLQPNYSKVWAFIAWDLSYNVSVEINNLEDRWFWVKRGISYLRDKGIPYNKFDPELYAELSWIYHHKIGNSLDYAHRYYRSELARSMQQVLNGPGDRELLEKLVSVPATLKELKQLEQIKRVSTLLQPLKLKISEIDNPATLSNLSQKQKAIMADEKIQKAIEIVKLFKLRKKLSEELKLDVNYMLYLNRQYGPLDWRGCDAHALYWACYGRDVARRTGKPKSISMKHERLVYFSLAEMYKRGKVYLSSENIAYNVPDYRFLEPTRKAIKDLLDRGAFSVNKRGNHITLTGVTSGYVNFMREAILMYYFNGQTRSAARFIKFLQEFQPANKSYQVNPEKYVRREIKEFVDAMSMDRFAGLLESFLRESFFYLSIGDAQNAREKEAWGKMLYKYGLRRWPQKPGEKDQFVGAVPPLPLFTSRILVRILDGQDPRFSPSRIKTLKQALGAEKIKAVQEKAARFSLRKKKK